MFNPLNNTKRICLTLFIVVGLYAVFFFGKRIYYSNRGFFYRHGYFRPDNGFEARYYGFLATKPNSSEIIFAGTSLTQGFSLQQLFNNRHIKNMGFGWNKTYNMLPQVTNYVKRKPAKIFLEIGINDLRYGFNNDSIFNNFVKICTIVQKASVKTRLYVQAVLPTSTDLLNQHIIAYNQKVKAYCIQYKITFINLYPIFIKGKSIDSCLTTDGIHLNKKGYLLWAECIKPYIVE